MLRENVLLKLYLLFAAFVLFSLWQSENFQHGVKILDTLAFFFVLPLTLGTSRFTFDAKHIHAFKLVFVTACAAACVIAFISVLVKSDLENRTGPLWNYFSYTSLAGSINLNPIYFSLYLIVSIIFLLELREEKKRHRAVFFLLLSLFFLVIILLASRMAIALAFLLVVVDTVSKARRRQWFEFRILALTFLLMVTLAIVNPVSRSKGIFETIESEYFVKTNTHYNTSTEIRASLYWLSWERLKRFNPLLGDGIGDVEDNLRNLASSTNVTNIHHYYHPHSEYIFFLLAMGIPGLMVFICLLIMPAYVAWKERNFVFFSILLLIIISGCTEPIFERQKTVILYSLFISLFAFHPNRLFNLKSVKNISRAVH